MSIRKKKRRVNEMEMQRVMIDAVKGRGGFLMLEEVKERN